LAKKKISRESNVENSCTHQVIEENGKYYCPECRTEVPVKEDCPGCKKALDWHNIQFNARRAI